MVVRRAILRFKVQSVCKKNPKSNRQKTQEEQRARKLNKLVRQRHQDTNYSNQNIYSEEFYKCSLNKYILNVKFKLFVMSQYELFFLKFLA